MPPPNTEGAMILSTIFAEQSAISVVFFLSWTVQSKDGDMRVQNMARFRELKD